MIIYRRTLKMLILSKLNYILHLKTVFQIFNKFMAYKLCSQ